MPKGVYKRTLEHRLNTGKTKIGNKNRLGKHHTSETKLKISQSNLGREIPNRVREQISRTLKNKYANGERVSWSKGLTKETNSSLQRLSILYSDGRMKGDNNPARKLGVGLKISNKKLGRPNPAIRGSNNGNWNGGIMFEPYTSEFNKTLKQKMRRRDNYICQLCGVPECECLRKLSVHHIDYNKRNCLSGNLISLCNKCNARINLKRDNWIKYFSTSHKMKKSNLTRLARDFTEGY